ncbi:AMP-binding protein [Neptunomonas antarctica]|uniref:Long-chain-fatty-acid--CoA ligase n=1 Tax=Neptunomonas antarctica TaxID=619304 RepID=A0A1N7N7D9_9GAMM|nr:AMP-binding protein [Neptunomonas antarctica]SIS94283.1 long-chain acyl-CoA synthetase [Neptunomonas antarctica]
MSDARGTWIPEELNPEGYKTILDVVASVCQRYAERPAFTSFGRTLTYGELDRLSDAFAVYIQEETDLQPGDRLAIQLPNLIQYPIVLFGALRAGLVVVNTNPLYTPRELEHQFNDSGAKALVIHASMAHNAEKIIDKTQIKHIFVTQVGDLHGFIKRTLLNTAIKYIKKMEPDYNLPMEIALRAALLSRVGRKPTPVPVQTKDVAVLQYTGGTTGVSKGAILTHGNLVSNMLQGRELISRGDSHWADTAISPLPLYHIYAFTLSQVVMETGGHSVLIANPRDIPGFVKEMKRWNMTSFMGLNTLFVALCNNDDFKTLDFGQLKVTISGGMALTNAAADQWKTVTGCEIMEGYGLTETSPAVAINPPGNVCIGTIGWPLKATDVRIIDTYGAAAPAGVVGELCVKGPQVMQGYWQRERETKASFTDDGYLITGDIAVRDEDGRLRIVDRAKDLIIVSGFNVYPNEIEDVVTSHPDVIECAAIGVKDERSGEVPKLFVVRKDPLLTEKTVIKWCKENLTNYKIPKSVIFVDDLPKSNVGKVLRRMLKNDGE